MHRRTFLAAATGGIAAYAAAAEFELDDLGLAELSQGMAQGRWTSRRLVELYSARIDAIDGRGPRLNAVIEMNPDAASIADSLDRERKQGHVRGPLHGIPVLLKDNIDTADRMSTTAGSLALDGWHPPRDAFLASRLRAAGALILGKTNLSEWANFRSTRSVSGWSGRGGQTRNPHLLERSPSGSSSGSAAAVAASLCAAAVGSETDGSIVSPSSICGVVGVKPTVGLVSRSGIIPISHSQDTAGPIARSVRDAAILLTAMAAADPNDPATAESAGRTQPDYTKSLDANGLRGARLGIARKYFEDNRRMNGLLNDAIDVLKRAGAEIVDPADLPSHGKGGDEEEQVLLYEFKADLNAYLAKLPPTREERSLAALIDFNNRHRDREMPWFDQELFEQAQEKGPLTEQKYIDARKQCLKLARKEGIDAALDKHRVDAIVTLTCGPSWMVDHVNGDRDVGGCSSPAAVAGYPHVTVPAAMYDELR
ncbi:MAG TPA: amidase, partial [Bryobacteraceae bacterium]|nr:amidase [Bryobacteraceae bacterium]